MKHIEFTTVTLSNFKSFYKRAALALDGTGLTRVTGRNDLEPRLTTNDCGKTTIFDGITWCLYGKTVGGLRNNDVKSWDSTNSTKVVVALTVNDNEYEISRRVGPNKLLINNTETSQEYIDNLLGMNFDIFTNTVLMGQGRPLFLDLEPRRKMDLFSNILMLHRWEERSKKASKAASELELELSTKVGLLEGGEASLKQIDTLLIQTKEQAAEWENNKKTKTRNQQNELEKLKKELDAAQTRRDAADLTYDGSLTEAKQLEKEIEKHQSNLLAASSVVYNADLSVADTSRNIDKVTQNLRKLGETDTCPICGQPVVGTQLASHKQELKKELSTLKKLLNQQIEAHTIAVKTMGTIKDTVTTATRHLNEFKRKAAKVEDSYREQSRLATELQTKVYNLEQQCTERSNEVNPHRNQLHLLRNNKNELEAKLDKLDKDITLLERKISRTKFWIKGFKYVRLQEIEDVLQELEIATNALLPESGLEDWEINYDVERETKTGTIQHGLNTSIISPRNKKPVKWEVWGGGVGQRLRLVATMALSEVLLERAGVSTNIEILDEPTKGLSSEGVQDLVEFLSERAKRLEKSIFLIDHHAISSSHFTDTVLVVKGNNGSKLE